MDYLPAPDGALNKPTYARIRDQLRHEILSGHWPVGQHLSLEKLSRHYQTSLNPVREAMMQLHGEGILLLERHRGATVRELDARTVAQLIEVRAALESMMARRACELIDAAGLARIEACNAEFDRAIRRRDDAAAIATNRAFHETLHSIAGNDEARAIMAGRAELVFTLRRRFPKSTAVLRQAHADHLALIDALKRRDGDAAARVASEHVLRARDYLVTRLQAEAAGQPATQPARRGRPPGARNHRANELA
ncbi:MAG: GntR family transcriptional regulator [Lautropia sp.]